MLITRTILCALVISLASFWGCVPVARKLSLGQQVAREAKLVRLLEQATHNLRSGRHKALDKAQAGLLLAQELGPNDPRVLDGLGCVAFRMGHQKLAVEYYKQALRENPEYDRAYAHLALIAERDGNYEAAKELLKIAIKLNPLNYRARNNYALLLKTRSGRKEGKKDAYEELLKASQSIERKDPVVEYNLKRVQGQRP